MADELLALGLHLWESIGDGAILLDGAEIARVNPALEALIGSRSGQLIGRALGDLVSIAGATGAESLGDLLGAAAGEQRRAAVRFRTAAGTTRPGELTLRPLGDGRLLGLIRPQPEDRAEVAALRLRSAALENSTSGFHIVDRNGVFVDANRAFCEQWGYGSAEEVIGTSPVEYCVDPKQPARMRSAVAEHGETRSEFTARRRDGARFEVEMSLFSGSDEQGQPLFIGSSVDVTERRRLEAEDRAREERMAEAQRMESVGRLAAGVAHDFNNMLSPILVYTDILQHDPRLNATQREQLEVAFVAADRCRALTRRLLAFSRRQVLDLHAADLGAIVNGLRPLIERSLRENVRLRIDLPDEDCIVLADCDQVEQVITNLVINAQDAMPDGGQLHVQVTERTLTASDVAGRPDGVSGRFGVITVSDSGTGIDPELQSRVFEPFFTTKGDQGTGLGLATVYGIAKQHGGNVWLYSEPAKGTTLRVFLPLTDRPARPLVDEPRTETRGQGELVLVVEDDELVRSVARTVLERQGYRVAAAASAAEALTLLEEHSTIDLLLTDVVLPDMNGRALSDRIGELRPGIPVLYMSGYTADVIAHHGIQVDGADLVQKPFTERELSMKIRRILKRVRR